MDKLPPDRRIQAMVYVLAINLKKLPSEIMSMSFYDFNMLILTKKALDEHDERILKMEQIKYRG